MYYSVVVTMYMFFLFIYNFERNWEKIETPSVLTHGIPDFFLAFILRLFLISQIHIAIIMAKAKQKQIKKKTHWIFGIQSIYSGADSHCWVVRSLFDHLTGTGIITSSKSIIFKGGFMKWKPTIDMLFKHWAWKTLN